jgi:hypothetical protein
MKTRVLYCHSERMRGIFPRDFSLSAGVRKIMNHFVVKFSALSLVAASPR